MDDDPAITRGVAGDDFPVDPLDALRRWPADRPVALLHSGRHEPAHARWSLLAEPAAFAAIHADGAVDLQRLDERADALPETRRAHHPLHTLDELLTGAPDAGGWFAAVSYDLGRCIEPAAQRPRDVPRAADDRAAPVISLAWAPDGWRFDHATKSWRPFGAPADRFLTSRAARRAIDRPPPMVGGLRSASSPDAHRAAVGRTVEYILAGDIFQANITQRFTAPFSGSTRDLAAAAFDVSRPWYGAYLELPAGRTLLSLSPELFLQVDAASRRVATRPIKGTRPAHADPADLLASGKDAAELAMIIDLMRNDLGRICTIGSVRVTEPRAIETHPTVHHTVGAIEGVLPTDVGAADLLRATFPPGSVTGAPKIRAMQIIDELEPVRRGVYCGAIGWLGADGEIALNVAIRTLQLDGVRASNTWEHLDGRLDYSAGGGVVAESDPEAEFAESLDKTAVLHNVLQALDQRRARTAAPA